MDLITIQPFSITTTRVGFGCSSLVGRISRKDAEALVNAAYDSGIRHFDVARSYGRGAAESLLGKALGTRRKEVTITSKFGLPVARRRPIVDAARALLRPAARYAARLRPGKKSGIENVDFSREHAEKSLETSLRELGTDRLDILLLHEASTDALTDSSLLDFLEQSRRAGKIKGYGIGTRLEEIGPLLRDCPAYCPIVQHQWSPLTGDVALPPSSFRITHGALAHAFERLREAFRRDPALAASASNATGLDMMNPENLAAVLLRSAAVKYPDSITLFSARSVRRVQENARALNNAQLDHASRGLLRVSGPCA